MADFDEEEPGEEEVDELAGFQTEDAAIVEDDELEDDDLDPLLDADGNPILDAEGNPLTEDDLKEEDEDLG